MEVVPGMPMLLTSLDPLVRALVADGYRVIGPTVRDGAIMLSELDSADALPHGWGVTAAPGRYRLHRRADAAAFAHAAGPQSWKAYLHPPRSPLWTATKSADGFTVTEAPEDTTRYAFLGVRGCDLRAIAVQDRVLGGVDGGYARRRRQLFIVAVSCTEPADTCFCAATGCGPGVAAGFDLALTELADGDAVRYVVETGSAAGERILDALPTEPAGAADVEQAHGAVAAAAGRMTRSLPRAAKPVGAAPGQRSSVDLHGLLTAGHAAARWDDVASRCLSCGNCTMVCPTCFCTTVEDVTDVAGEHAERWLRWDSCFDLDFSYLHGGPVRTSTRSRYRQWLTHKLGTWHDQFGESGCVGCGRCIAWCPVGIDITAEVAALAAETEET
jgi:ferredoxin